jgi:hypothetical protein
VPLTSQAMLRDAIQLRWQAGDSLPLTMAQLATCLPPILPGFVPGAVQSKQFMQHGVPFRWVMRQDQQAHDTYISVTLCDYAADTSGLLRLWQHWQPIDTSGYAQFAPFYPSCWQWRSPTPQGGLGLDLVLDSRYLLTLQTNHPESKAMLLRTWQAWGQHWRALEDR